MSSAHSPVPATFPGPRLTRRRLAQGMAGLGLAAPLAGAALRAPGLARAQTPVAGGELRLTLAASANVNLNPIGVTTIGAFYLQSVMYDGLVTSSATWDEVEPGLAESWDLSDDGLTYTFHLRPDVIWHDGEPFTAADVEFTYRTLLTAAVGSYFANNLTAIAGGQAFLDGEVETIDGLQIVDDQTINFVLEAPNAPFVFAVLTQHSIIPKHVWEAVAPAELAKPGTWEQGQIGTGPFQFSAYEPDRFLEFVRFDDAWRGAPLLDKVLFVHVGTTPEATAAALEAGDVDFAAGIPASELDRLRAVPTLRMELKQVPNVRFLSVNVSKPYLADKRVRQAFALGIDRAGLVEAVLTNSAALATSITPSAKWRNDDVATYPYDPEAAKALLAEAGWDPSQTIELSLYYQDQPQKDAIALMQQQLGEIGVQANVVQLDGSAVQSYYYDDAAFDVMLGGYGASPDFDEFNDIFACDATWPAGQNAMGYCNEEVDALFAQGRETSDETARKRIYDELQVILADELPWIPFYYLVQIGGFNTRVHNADAILYPWNRPYNWSIEQVFVSSEA